MPPLKLTKALSLSFVLSAVLSVVSDAAISHQVQRLAVAQAQAVASHVVADVGSRTTRTVARKLGQWTQNGLEALLKRQAHMSTYTRLNNLFSTCTFLNRNELLPKSIN